MKKCEPFRSLILGGQMTFYLGMGGCMFAAKD